MKEYKYVSLKKNIIDTINDVAKEGWKLVAYSASNVLALHLSMMLYLK